MSETGNILEDLESGVDMLLEGAWSKIKTDAYPFAPKPELVTDMVFSVLCALHERATRAQIHDVLYRISDGEVV